MEVIGVAGQAQNGKDTVSDYLQKKLNERHGPTLLGDDFWHRGAFAKSVKEVFCESFGKDLEYVEKWKVIPEAPPDLDLSVRKALQFIGDGFRQIKGSIWVDILFRRQKYPLIVSDVRYPNELKAVKERNGLNFLIVHPDRVNDDPNGSEAYMKPLAQWALQNCQDVVARDILPEYLTSDSPADLRHVDYVIINRGSKENLYDVLDLYIPRIEAHFDAEKGIKECHTLQANEEVTSNL